MNTYNIYFEFLGKKMQTKIKANSRAEAIDELEYKLEIKKVDLIEGSEPVRKSNTNFLHGEETLNNLKDIFGFNK